MPCFDCLSLMLRFSFCFAALPNVTVTNLLSHTCRLSGPDGSERLRPGRRMTALTCFNSLYSLTDTVDCRRRLETLFWVTFWSPGSLLCIVCTTSEVSFIKGVVHPTSAMKLTGHIFLSCLVSARYTNTRHRLVRKECSQKQICLFCLNLSEKRAPCC